MGRVESIVALVLFVPIVLGLAGSVGAQSAQIAVRGLQEGNLSIARSLKVLGKEAAMGFVIASVASLLVFLIAALWRKSPEIGVALGLSIAAVMIGSGFLGMILPVVFRVFRLPSNRASGLFLLLICDIFALILYFIIALSFVSPTIELG